MAFQAGEETLSRTTMGTLMAGSLVNVERAMKIVTALAVTSSPAMWMASARYRNVTMTMNGRRSSFKRRLR